MHAGMSLWPKMLLEEGISLIYSYLNDQVKEELLNAILFLIELFTYIKLLSLTPILLGRFASRR